MIFNFFCKLGHFDETAEKWNNTLVKGDSLVHIESLAAFDDPEPAVEDVSYKSEQEAVEDIFKHHFIILSIIW